VIEVVCRDVWHSFPGTRLANSAVLNEKTQISQTQCSVVKLSEESRDGETSAYASHWSGLAAADRQPGRHIFEFPR
jgi:hypothetical protein